MKLTASVTLALALLASSAVAGPVEDREAFMKENGHLLGEMVPIARGQKEFDAAQVMQLLKQFGDHSQELDVVAMFPEGTAGQAGTENRAAPAIWENFDDFKAKAEKFKADAAEAAGKSPKDAAELGAILGMVGENCRSCHETYRLPES